MSAGRGTITLRLNEYQYFLPNNVAECGGASHQGGTSTPQKPKHERVNIWQTTCRSFLLLQLPQSS